MLDNAILARKLAAIRDAVVLINLFVAFQESIALATHWLADAGWEVPHSHGEVFTIPADRRRLAVPV